MDFGDKREEILQLPPQVGPPDPPELWLENIPYCQAWWKLHALRPEGFTGMVALAPDFIEAWARHHWFLEMGPLVRRIVLVDAFFRAEVKTRQAVQAEADAVQVSAQNKKGPASHANGQRGNQPEGHRGVIRGGG